jgi:ABC-type taurine transport system ATPase subunit
VKASPEFIKMREQVLKIIFGDEDATGGDHV